MSAIRVWRTTLAVGSYPSCLVDPEEMDAPVEVAGYRGEHTVPPLEGGLVGDAVRLCRALDGDVVAREPDEGDPDGERLLAVLEDGALEGVEPPGVAAAAPPRDAGGGGGAAYAAFRAFGGPTDRLQRPF